MRPTKDEYYLQIALDVARRGTCLKRNFGAVIVNHDQIISTGYTGAPRGVFNCCDTRVCRRADAAPGTRYEDCISVHAEQNAMINASRLDILGGVIYVNGINSEGEPLYPKDYTGPICIPCEICKRMIINAGIDQVVSPTGDYGVWSFFRVNDPGRYTGVVKDV